MSTTHRQKSCYIFLDSLVSDCPLKLFPPGFRRTRTFTPMRMRRTHAFQNFAMETEATITRLFQCISNHGAIGERNTSFLPHPERWQQHAPEVAERRQNVQSFHGAMTARSHWRRCLCKQILPFGDPLMLRQIGKISIFMTRPRFPMREMSENYFPLRICWLLENGFQTKIISLPFFSPQRTDTIWTLSSACTRDFLRLHCRRNGN